MRIKIRQSDDGMMCLDECMLLLKDDRGLKDNCPRCIFSERHTDCDQGGMWWLDTPGDNCPGHGDYELNKVTGDIL